MEKITSFMDSVSGTRNGEFRMFIDGRWVESASGEWIDVRNPAGSGGGARLVPRRALAWQGDRRARREHEQAG